MAAEYCFERLDELDRKTSSIMFQAVLPNYVIPVVHNRLQHWVIPDTVRDEGDVYAALCECFEMSPNEKEQFFNQCIKSLTYERPWWLPHGHLKTIVQDMASRTRNVQQCTSSIPVYVVRCSQHQGRYVLPCIKCL
jgi:hypothetical protein